jgi:hypothetical protein
MHSPRENISAAAAWTMTHQYRYHTVCDQKRIAIFFGEHNQMEAVLLLLRWAHILGAVLTVGGLFFARFAFLPAVAEVDDATREKLHEAVRRRWLPWVIGGITLLLASGLTNFLLFNNAVKSQGWEDGQWMRQTNYHAIFGVKFLLALGIFYFASGLVGRGSGTAWIRRDRARWLTVTLGLAVAVVMLSGWLRNLHTGPNLGPSEAGVQLQESLPSNSPDPDRYENSAAGSAFRETGDSQAVEKPAAD